MGGGKNARVDTNAVKRMSATQNTRERLKKRMLQKKASEAEAFIKEHQKSVEAESFMNNIPEELLTNDGVDVNSTPSKKKNKKNKKNGK